MRWLGWAVGIVLVVLVAGAAGLFVFGGRLELAGLAAGRASARLGRAVGVGSLHVTPGRWVTVELRDARVANLPGGTRADMAVVGRVSAEVQLTSLLRGPPVVRKLVVDGVDVLLERTAAGVRNWRFHEREEDGKEDRSGFPTLLDATLTGAVVVRTGSGAALRTTLDGVRITMGSATEPVLVKGPGSYKAVPIEVDMKLGPIAVLRDASVPYPTDIRLSSDETALLFQGTMTKPFEVDGAHGNLSLDAITPEVIFRIAGIDSAVDTGLQLSGQMTHEGPVWHLQQATGLLGQGAIEKADLRLDEGRADEGVPDKVRVVIDFDQLDLDGLVAGKAGDGGADMSLRVDRAPSTVVDAKLSAHGVTYNGLRMTGATLDASLAPGKLSVESLALSYLGGQVRASGTVEAAGGTLAEKGAPSAAGRVHAAVDVAGLDVQAARRVLSMGSLPVQGRVSGHVVAAGQGATLNQAARGARLSAVLTMAGGSVSKEIVELASTDPRALFRTARGVSAISCAVGVLDVRAGVGTVAPLRVRTADGTIAGRGTVDLVRRRLDLTIASEARTTGPLALDVPVRVSGAFDNPLIEPAALSAAGRAQLGMADEPGRLAGGLAAVARRSPCLQGGR